VRQGVNSLSFLHPVSFLEQETMKSWVTEAGYLAKDAIIISKPKLRTL